MKLPFRTGTTSLTDDELVLLDVLFGTWACPAKLLRRRSFLPQWNFGYSHDLDDRQLRATLTELWNRGLLRPELDEKDVYFAMTPTGGELWSQERLPVWERYYDTRFRSTQGGRTMMSVLAVSGEVRDRFLELCPIESAKRRRRQSRDVQILSWRSFPSIHLGVASYPETDESPATREYWVRIERERIGWRNVKELQRFLPGSSQRQTGASDLDDEMT